MRYIRSLIAIGLVLGLTACSACAPSNASLKGHSYAAETLDTLAADAKETVLEMRQVELDRAAADARTIGLTGDELRAAVERAAAKYDAGPALPAVNAFIAAKDAYVRTVLAAASKDKPSWVEAKRVLKDVVDAYANMRKALGEPAKLPPVPDAIAKLLTRIEPGGLERPPVEVVA